MTAVTTPLLKPKNPSFSSASGSRLDRYSSSPAWGLEGHPQPLSTGNCRSELSQGADTTLGGAPAPLHHRAGSWWKCASTRFLFQFSIPASYLGFLFWFSHCSLSQERCHPSSNPSTKHTPSPPVSLTPLHILNPSKLNILLLPSFIQLFPLSFICQPQMYSSLHTSKALLSLICTLSFYLPLKSLQVAVFV